MTSWLSNPIRLTARMIALTIVTAIWMAISPTPAHCFPWSIDMYRGPEVQPLAEAPRVTPADTLPVHGGEPPMSLEQATIKMHNPLQPSAQNLASGHQQFDTYCAPCHGATGQGDGPAAHILSKPPKNLISGSSKFLPDGYIYGAIRDGILSMPSYAEELPVEQRWQVVTYLRSMQQGAGKGKVAGN
jgi:cytochrome c553